jgi:GAF domain-containing protein
MTPQSFEQNLQQEPLLYRLSNRIRQSLELQDILSTAVQEIRAFLSIDRVKIYRFESDRVWGCASGVDRRATVALPAGPAFSRQRYF